MQNNVRIVFLLNIYELIIIGLLQTDAKVSYVHVNAIW